MPPTYRSLPARDALAALLVAAGLLAGCGDSKPSPGDAATDAPTPPVDSGTDGTLPAFDAWNPGTWIRSPSPALPTAPAWTPSFLDGTPGWQSSTVPFCNQETGTLKGHSVYADANAVYAATIIENNAWSGTSSSLRPWGLSVQRNDGTGWTERFFAPPQLVPNQPMPMYAKANGALLLHLGHADCGVIEVAPGPLDSDSITCSLAESSTLRNVFFVSDDLAYALTSTAILKYDGAQWSELVALPEGHDTGTIWGNESLVVAVGLGQTVFTYENGTLTDHASALPAGGHDSAWAFAADDIWIGNLAGQLHHYDGVEWSTIDLGLQGCPDSPVRELWGHSGTLYFITGRAFGRWNGSSVERLVDLPCSSDVRFQGMWGRPDGSEIYLTISDYDFIDYACGTTFTVWFDGQDFHRF